MFTFAMKLAMNDEISIATNIEATKIITIKTKTKQK